MKALILAAGYGTRLYPLVKNTAKALLEVNGKPLINYIIDKIKDLDGLKEIYVVSNEKFSKDFEKWAKEQKISQPIKVINDQTQTPETRLGSIGDIDFVLNNAQINDEFLVIGGDNLFDYSLNDFILFCRKHPDAVSIGLYDIENMVEAKSFGVVAVDQSSKIVSFEEKPENPKSSLIAMCLYYFPKSTLGLVKQYLNESKKSDKAGEYIKWLQEKSHVYGFKFSGKWYDIGSIESYKEAQSKFKP